MSQENVEVVRETIEAWNARDMDGVRDRIAVDVIGRAPEGWPEPGPFVGQKAVMRQFEQMRDVFHFDVLETIGDFIAAADRVAVRVIWRGAGHGPEANVEMTDVFTVRNGKIFGIEVCWDHADALETLGLSEQDAHADP